MHILATLWACVCFTNVTLFEWTVQFVAPTYVDCWVYVCHPLKKQQLISHFLITMALFLNLTNAIHLNEKNKKKLREFLQIFYSTWQMANLSTVPKNNSWTHFHKGNITTGILKMLCNARRMLHTSCKNRRQICMWLEH